VETFYPCLFAVNCIESFQNWVCRRPLQKSGPKFYNFHCNLRRQETETRFSYPSFYAELDSVSNLYGWKSPLWAEWRLQKQCKFSQWHAIVDFIQSVLETIFLLFVISAFTIFIKFVVKVPSCFITSYYHMMINETSEVDNYLQAPEHELISKSRPNFLLGIRPQPNL